MKVRVLPGTVLDDNKRQYHPGDELEMDDSEAGDRIDQGKVEAVNGTESGKKSNAGGNQLSAAEAIAMAKAATNKEALEALFTGETRATVLAAIETRRKELEV